VSDRLYLGVDVGTSSVRAGLFDASGARRGLGVAPIRTWREGADIVEQSSDDIWRGACEAIRQALAENGTDPLLVCGIGFDATCSLVVLDAADRPVGVGSSGGEAGDDARNVIVWMDHRATDQARRINATRHDVLRYVGGTISPEMETPKLLWLKENAPAAWKRAARFLDLPDYLSCRATGTDTRSLCTTVCKWTYLGHDGPTGRWSDDYFRRIGLGELVDEGYRRIGTRVRPMGERAGTLTRIAAKELGLEPGTPVAVSIIDAHAGGLGMLGASIDGVAPTRETLDERLAIIGGTSTCHMAVSVERRFVPGVWGPYYSAMVPGMWLTEGGQSATGALLDFIVRSHARGAELAREAAATGVSVYTLLNDRLAARARTAAFPAELARNLHVLPDHHGNRSPRADPTLRGMVSGLDLDDSVDALALVYLAAVQALAHGTRHILDALRAAGYPTRTLVACGGDTKNPLFLREHADVTGCRIVLPAEPEAVLLGSAMLGAVAASDHATIVLAMGAMSRAGKVVEPTGGEVAAFHDKKHGVFHRMHADQLAYRELMKGGQ
jgi:FGGY-family pentulose kinase